MRPGDIIDVMNLEGQIYEVILRSGDGNIWEIEWIGGPEDGEVQELEFKDESPTT